MVTMDRNIGECYSLEGSTHRKGYVRVDVGNRSHGKGKARYLSAHRVAWMAVNGPIPEGGQILHHCDNRACIRASHLYLGNNDDNVRDRVMRLRSWRKLSDDDVTAIRQRHANGAVQKDLAIEYGVSKAQISRIVNGLVRKGSGAGR
jgi:hypothetical protein